MTTYLQQQIEDRMRAKNLTIYALEKKAGLNRSAVRNILQGFSKNPSIEILRAITIALDCSLDDLIHINKNPQESHKYIDNDKIKKNDIWQENLYVDSVKIISKFLHEKKLNLSLEQITNLINEAYQYSVSKNSNQIDKDFCRWIISKNI